MSVQCSHCERMLARLGSLNMESMVGLGELVMFVLLKLQQIIAK